ncbi:cardiolipin synthase [Mycoplasma todarodis]|uniref:cardiolipin synthase n=1 Tax=Mycoplasma todarodis TaxID=1937191 RepID=UPI003B3391E1
MKIIRRLFTLLLTLSFIAAIGYLLFGLYEWGVYLTVLILFVVYLVTAIWALLLFAQKRHLPAKASWYLIVILLPVFGIIIYMIFGRRYKGRKSLKDFHKEYSETYSIQEESVKTKNEILKEQNQFSKLPILNGDLKIYDNGMYAFKDMFEDLKNAKKFIHLNYYIIKMSEIWEELKQILIKKVNEGVEVRLIVDDFGRWALPWYEIKSLEKKGIQISIYDKVSFPFISSQNGCRSHRKYASIDGNVGYTGGVNLSDEYVNYSKEYGIWEDLVMRVEGQAVRAFSLLFINDWKLINKTVLDTDKYAPKVKSKFKNKILLIEDGPEIKIPLMQDSLVHWISKAKKSITLSTPYFVPTAEVISALRTASLSGIEVKLFLPGQADKKSAFQASKGNAALLEEYGVKTYLINDKFLHSKAGVFDGETAYLGTMNIDIRSFHSQFENLSLFEGPEVKKLEEIFERYEKNSVPLEKMGYNPKGVWNKIRMTFLKILAPMM